MRRTLVLFTLASALAAPAFADDNRIVKSVSLKDLETILVEEGHTIMSTGDDGAVSVRATDTNGTGLIFNLLGTACGTEYSVDCLGINMQVRYDADGTESLERINAANLMWGATSAWYSADGFDPEEPVPTVGISRYVILDGGMTRRNVKDNLLNLLAIAPQVADYVWETGAYAPGGAEEGAGSYYDDEW
jgi:hypothetical protein